jgi:hypothetical protein
LSTVTLTEDEVVEFPAASLATAVMVCVPSATLVESQVIPYVEVVSSEPTFVPSTLN